MADQGKEREMLNMYEQQTMRDRSNEKVVQSNKRSKASDIDFKTLQDDGSLR